MVVRENLRKLLDAPEKELRIFHGKRLVFPRLTRTVMTLDPGGDGFVKKPTPGGGKADGDCGNDVYGHDFVQSMLH